MSYSSGAPVELDDPHYGQDAAEAQAEAEYIADRNNRSGLPDIPKGAPPLGDKIDLDQIQAEYNTCATRRASPSQAGEFKTAATYPPSSGGASSTPASIPLRSVGTSGGTLQPIVRPEEDDDFDDFSYQPPERRATHKTLPKKTFFTAAFLLFVGVLFSTLGLSFLFTLGLSEALPFLIIGGIGFIPGSYVSFIIYQTWKGVPGYSYDQIPTYDD